MSKDEDHNQDSGPDLDVFFKVGSGFELVRFLNAAEENPAIPLQLWFAILNSFLIYCPKSKPHAV
jgi:hypothetical protein